MKKQGFTFATIATLLVVVLMTNLAQIAKGQMIDRTSSRVQTTLNTGWKTIGSVAQKGVADISVGQNWTLGCETLCRDYIYWDTYKEYVAPLGIKRIRLQGGWAKTEQVKGQLDFQWLDDVIDDALARGLTVWLETDYGNPIYEGGGGKDLADGFPTSEEALAAWDHWVEAMALRYKDKVWAWAMWNEPDIGTPKKTPIMVADFNIRTAEVIKKVIPDARIGALSLASNSPKYLEECLNRLAEQGKLNLFEWVIYHGYTKNPDDAYPNVEKMREVLVRVAPRLKLWQGENGCPSQRATRFALSNHDWTELTQAKWDTRRMLGDLGHDVMSSVFTICDFDHVGRERNHKGLLKTNDKWNLAKVKMAWYAVQNVVSVFDDRLERQAGYQINIASEVPVTWFAYRDKEAKQDLLVLWNGKSFPVDTNDILPVTITIEKGLFSDPVWADIITGQIQEIPAELKQIEEGRIVLKNIPVYDAPVVITDRVRLIPE